MIILPVRNMVLFPGMVIPVAIGRTRSVAAAQQAVREQRPNDEVELPFPRTAPRHKPFRLKAVPYYAWDNRDEGDMQVWLREAATG